MSKFLQAMDEMCSRAPSLEGVKQYPPLPPLKPLSRAEAEAFNRKQEKDFANLLHTKLGFSRKDAEAYARKSEEEQRKRNPDAYDKGMHGAEYWSK